MHTSGGRRAYKPSRDHAPAPSLTQLYVNESRGTCASDACGMDAYPGQQRACLDGSWSRAQHRWVVVGVFWVCLRGGMGWDGWGCTVLPARKVQEAGRRLVSWFRRPAVAELHVTYSLTTAAPSLPCLTTASPPIGPAQSPCSGAETAGSHHAPLGRRTVPKRVVSRLVMGEMVDCKTEGIREGGIVRLVLPRLSQRMDAKLSSAQLN